MIIRGLFYMYYFLSFLSCFLSKPNKCFAESRPVSILSVLNKVYETILLDATLPTIEAHLPPNLFAYRRWYSTFLAIAVLDLHVERARHSGLKCLVLFRDVEGAFQSGSHLHLIEQLSEFDVPQYLLRLLWAYLKVIVFHGLNHYTDGSSFYF